MALWFVLPILAMLACVYLWFYLLVAAPPESLNRLR